MDKYKKILSGYKALGFNEEMLMDDILIVFMIRQKIRNQRKSVDYLYDNEKMRFLWSETVDELSQKISSLNRSNKSIRDRFIMV